MTTNLPIIIQGIADVSLYPVLNTETEINSYKQTDAVAGIYIIEEGNRGTIECLVLHPQLKEPAAVL